MDNYDILKKIGSGSFAKVYTAIHKSTGKKVALKIIHKKKVSNNSKLRQRLETEIKHMELLEHENIVQYYESFETDKDLYIIMEYLPGGELFDFIADRQGLDEAKGRHIFGQIAAAIQHCHQNNISHRDLKLENILLDDKDNPKLIDFGLSTTSHPIPTLATYCGSALYASPEMIAGKPYKGPECDVWSLGVILYCMLTASMPFDDTDWGSFMTCVNRADYPIPPNLSQNVIHLLSRMLDPCQRTRATISEVLCHAWLNPLPRKSSLQLITQNMTTHARRRFGISHSHSAALAIKQTIIAEVESSFTNTNTITQCDCTLQLEPDTDYGIELPHSCQKCNGHINNMKRHSTVNGATTNIPLAAADSTGIKASTISIASSGYSSSSDSLSSPIPLSYDCLPFQDGDNVDIVFV